MQSRNTSRRSQRTSRRILAFRPNFSTQTVIGMILGVFIAYGGYFLLYASNTDRRPAGPSEKLDTSYRNQALPLTSGKAADSDGVQLAQAAPLNPQGVEAPARGVSSPAEHRSVPPAAATTGPAVSEAPAAPDQAAPAKTVKKKRWTTRVKNLFTRNKDKAEAVPQAEEPQKTPPEETEGTARGLGASKENVDKTEQNLVRQVFGKKKEAPAPKQPEVAVQPVAVPAAKARPAVHVQTAGAPANSVIVTSGPSPQDETCRTLLFDASKSYDPDNDKLEYEWDFGDGTPPSDVVKTRHTFPQAGEYKVTLKVTDNSTKECSTAITQKLVIVNTPPVAVGIFPRTLKTYQAGLFDARRSSDTPGDRLSYLWNFGDSTVAEGPVVTHQYNKPGEYPVILTVRDSSGSSCDTSTVTHTVKVEEAALETPALALTAPEPIRPKIAAAPTPPTAVPVVQDTEAEMQGLLVQIRQHQGEPPKEMVAKKKPAPAPQPAAHPVPHIPLQLASVQTPIPPQPVEVKKEEKQYLPATHRYVLAWAGGYLVDCPTVQCGTETEASFQNRLERRLNHLIKAVSSDRQKLENLRDLSTEQKKQMVQYHENLQDLEDELVNFRNESTRYQKREFALANTRLDKLARKVEETHRTMLQAAAYTATNLQELGKQLEAHEKDEVRHKSAFEASQPYSLAPQPKQEVISRLPAPPPESE